ncbi:MAG: acyltransferase [Terracidiphilus sp.]
MQDQSTPRQFQLSYLRALVTLLVVAHHSALAYLSSKPPVHGFTALSLWWTAFPVRDPGSWPGLDLLVGWNDVFFMALMFFVSGLFVWPALRRHGAGGFIQRRFLRLGVPFLVAAGLLAPLAYYPAYLQLGGDTHLGSYARAWLALGEWPAGPAWFLWVLLVFDCVAALFFTALPNVFEALARGVRAVSNRPVLLFLLLAALSCAAYVPMAFHFGGTTWWSWGPFSVQSNRPLHYFVYFAMGMCLGAFGTEIPIFERAGRLARRWWLWGLAMVPAFLAIVVLMLSGKFKAAGMMFPVSCAASSLFLIAVVIRFARPSRWADSLSANAYGIYLLHYLFVIWIQYAALHWPTPALVKCAAVLVAATGLSWALAGLMRQSNIVARVV